MRILKTLRPGQKGTRKLLSRYGPTLLRVRYRYDEETRERLKTLELVVQRSSPQRDPECRESRQLGGRGRDRGGRRVALRIGWQERDLQRRVKSAGGRWDRVRKVWILRRDAAERLELLHRVVGGGGRG